MTDLRFFPSSLLLYFSSVYIFSVLISYVKDTYDITNVYAGLQLEDLADTIDHRLLSIADVSQVSELPLLVSTPLPLSYECEDECISLVFLHYFLKHLLEVTMTKSAPSIYDWVQPVQH